MIYSSRSLLPGHGEERSGESLHARESQSNDQAYGREGARRSWPVSRYKSTRFSTRSLVLSCREQFRRSGRDSAMCREGLSDVPGRGRTG